MSSRFFTSLCAALLIAAPAAAEEKAPPRDAAARQELLRFQGTWAVESVELDGKPVPPEEYKNRTIFFGGEAAILRQGKEVLQVAVQKIDPTKSPKTVNATVARGLYQGEAMLGIYEFSGDTLKVCFDIEGKNRPESFKTGPGGNRFLAVYKRVPPPADEKQNIIGKYQSVSVEVDGTRHEADAEIMRQGDSYLVRYTKNGALAYLGMGVRKGNVLSVCWANRSEIGISVYRIEKDGRLVGEYTQLGAVGILNSEILTPRKPEAPARVKKGE